MKMPPGPHPASGARDRPGGPWPPLGCVKRPFFTMPPAIQGALLPEF
jgi:hypothetical protein